jgi:hypothetical protein
MPTKRPLRSWEPVLRIHREVASLSRIVPFKQSSPFEEFGQNAKPTNVYAGQKLPG